MRAHVLRLRAKAPISLAGGGQELALWTLQGNVLTFGGIPFLDLPPPPIPDIPEPETYAMLLAGLGEPLLSAWITPSSLASTPMADRLALLRAVMQLAVMK